MKHAKRMKEATTIEEVFMGAKYLDYIMFEVFTPHSDSSDPSSYKVDIRSLLCGKKNATHDHTGVVTVDKTMFDGLSNVDMVFKCIELTYAALGFGVPTPGFQVCGSSIDGEIVTIRWSISKHGRKLTPYQLNDIAHFMSGSDALDKHTLVTLDYGNPVVTVIATPTSDVESHASTLQ